MATDRPEGQPPGDTDLQEGPPPRLAWLVAGAVMLATAAVVGFLALAGVGPFRGEERHPAVEAVNDYLNAVEDRDADRAYGLLCRALRDQAKSPSALRQTLEENARKTGRVESFRIEPGQLEGAVAGVPYEVTTDKGKKQSFVATVIQEEGNWRLCRFKSS